MKKKEKKQSEQNKEEIIPEDNSIEIERNESEVGFVSMRHSPVNDSP